MSVLIRLLKHDESKNIKMVQQMAKMINDVYKTVEKGLYKRNAERITEKELTELVKKEKIVAAFFKGKIIATIRVEQKDHQTGNLGLLSVHANYQQNGIGKRLIQFAEKLCQENKLQKIQLELLVPDERTHPFKEILAKWYTRLGYEEIGIESVADFLPDLNQKLAIPCHFIIFQKNL